MSNLKRRYLEVTLAVVILLIITFAGGHVFGAETKELVRPTSLFDFMEIPPNNVYQKYGYSDTTFLFYNIITVKERSQRNEVLIAALRAEVDELKKLVAELKGMLLTNKPPNSGKIMGHGHWPPMPDCKCIDPNEVAK